MPIQTVMPSEEQPHQTAVDVPLAMPEHIRSALTGSDSLRRSDRGRWIGVTAFLVLVVAGAVATGWAQLPH
jgi:hypothetical protein